MRIVVPLCAALASAALSSLASADQAAQAAAGERIFGTCKSCHQIGEGASNRTGPQLNDIFGRRAASLQDYNYSQSMQRAGVDGLVWTAQTLDAYIENPKSLVSKTRMNFRGLPDADDRAALLVYLRGFSDSPADISEAAAATAPPPSEPELDPAILALQGDAEYGEYLASECLACHQADGAADGIPAITGWPEDDFAVAMHAYKRKLRPHPVMQMMATRLSNEEIAALAAYFKDLD